MCSDVLELGGSIDWCGEWSPSPTLSRGQGGLGSGMGSGLN